MPQIYFGITTDGSASVLFGSPQYSFGFEQTQRNVVLNQQTGGTITAEPMSGHDNDVVTLSNTADVGYNFDTYNITGATLTGNQFMFNGYDVEVTPSFNRQVYTLTLQNDGHGTIAATKTTGSAGDTVTLSNTYNTYYRFNNYTQTGGSINGSTFTFGSQNATAKANFKVNAFTASGGWEKGDNVSPTNPTNSTKDTYSNVRKYATTSYHTSNVPAGWYSTSNRWNPSNASAYKITLKPIMKVQGTKSNKNYSHGGESVSFATLIGSTYSNTQTNKPIMSTSTGTTAATATYSKTITSTTQTTYSISARLHENYYNGYCGYVTYLGNQTTGTWTATGYAP